MGKRSIKNIKNRFDSNPFEETVKSSVRNIINRAYHTVSKKLDETLYNTVKRNCYDRHKKPIVIFLCRTLQDFTAPLAYLAFITTIFVLIGKTDNE